MTDPRPTLLDDIERDAWALVLARALPALVAELTYAAAYETAVELADRAILDMRARVAAGTVGAQIAAQSGSDPLALWPLCSACGKGPREGAHAGIGDWHDYQPGAMP